MQFSVFNLNLKFTFHLDYFISCITHLMTRIVRLFVRILSVSSLQIKLNSFQTYTPPKEKKTKLDYRTLEQINYYATKKKTIIKFELLVQSK